MVADDFLKAIEGVYGVYANPILRGTVKKYLLDDIKPTELSSLYRTVLYGHKAKFEAPCIASIEECIDKARLKKGKYEPYRIKEVKNVWDYKEQQKTNKELKAVDPELFKKLKEKVKIKKVGE